MVSIWTMLVLAAGLPIGGWAQDQAPSVAQRFFYTGDGRLELAGEKNGRTFSGPYRTAPGVYDPAALASISAVFGAPWDQGRMELSLRLVEFIDYLEDQLLPGARIVITSGYREPEYNTKLRDQGLLAAEASLHLYGMAADLIMEGVASKQVWNTVKKLGFGGTGYYNGKTVHVDVGPARSWDEQTSGVGQGLADWNKLIGLVTDFDRYAAGERMQLRFIRMTAFPIPVQRHFILEREAEGDAQQWARAMSFEPGVGFASQGACFQFADIAQMSDLHWRLPRNLTAGRYRVRAIFCDAAWEDMPDEIVTPTFEIR